VKLKINSCKFFGTKTMLIFVSTAIIAVFILSINTAIIFYKVHATQQPLSSTSTTLESNFQNFDIERFGIYPRTLRIISASTSSPRGTDIFTSSRSTSILRQYRFTKLPRGNGNLAKIAELDLKNMLGNLGNLDKKYWVFDLQAHKDQLYVSLVLQTQKLKSCDDYLIFAIPILNDRLNLERSKQIWKYNQCISSFPNDPGWHDFQGRIAVTDKFVYMTAGLLVASTGDGFYPNPALSGLLPTLEGEIARDKLFGGVLRLNIVTGESRLFATGFRGPSGITVVERNQTEQIWVADHGPRGGDELNLVRDGEDYGWPWVTFGKQYYDRAPGQSGYIDTQFGSHEGFTKPTFYWTPSIAPSQIITLKDNFGNNTNWRKGDLLLGSLKAESLFHIKLNGSDYVESVEQIQVGSRIRDLNIESQSVFMTTDDGQLIVLTPNSDKTTEGIFPPKASNSNPRSDSGPLSNIRSFIDRIGYSIQFRGTQIYRKLF
jgi:glucose/arabinose dehydrogenase